MNRILFAFIYAVLAIVSTEQVGGAQKIISGVPNYDQDLFPIDQDYASTERGDCTPVACSMVNGYYDGHGWPRLIPYGTNAANQNAWGVDTVVRKYKDQLGYYSWWIFEGTIFLPVWDPIINGKQGNAVVNVAKFFDSGAAFSREDDDFTDWTRIQSYLNADRPCVLTMHPVPVVAPQEYKWEGDSVTNLLGGGHSVCAVGWSDAGGRWVICNMGWYDISRAWFNYDNSADWYISQITPGGTPSGDDDDAYEDNDQWGATTAKLITPGIIANLRCLDTLIDYDDFVSSRGDWFRISVPAGSTLGVSIAFTHANGDLDLRLFAPNGLEAGSSEGSANSESVSVSSTVAGYYYVYVYGYDNAQNQNYSLTTSLIGAPSAIGLTCSVSPTSGSPGFPFTVSGGALYNNGGGNVTVGTATITVGGQTYTASINNGAYSRSIYAPATPGTYTVSVVAADGAGRSGSASSSVTVNANGTTSGYTINGYLSCQSADNGDPWQYHGAIDAFGSDDSDFYIWWEMGNITGQHSLQLKLYKPDGTLYGTDSTTFGESGYTYDWWRGWTSWGINGYDIADLEGRWTVKLYVDGGYKRTIYFTVRYEFKEHRLCKDHQASSPNDPINPTSIFTQGDAKAETWCKLDKVSNPLEMKWQWFEPNGSQYTVSTYNSTDPNSQGYDYWDWYKFWGSIGIQGNSAANKCGDWLVDVYIKDAFGNWDKEYTDYFRIIEAPAQAPSCGVTLGTTNPVPGQAVTLKVAATDNTYLKDVALYWKDGMQHSHVWNNIIAGSLNQNLNIGSFTAGQLVEFWVVATDTSGNARESSHQNALVRSPVVRPTIRVWKSDTQANIIVPTQIGYSYTLESKNAITDGTWTTMQTVSGDGGEKTLSDSTATVTQRVYRIRVQ